MKAEQYDGIDEHSEPSGPNQKQIMLYFPYQASSHYILVLIDDKPFTVIPTASRFLYNFQWCCATFYTEPIFNRFNFSWSQLKEVKIFVKIVGRWKGDNFSHSLIRFCELTRICYKHVHIIFNRWQYIIINVNVKLHSNGEQVGLLIAHNEITFSFRLLSIAKRKCECSMSWSQWMAANWSFHIGQQQKFIARGAWNSPKKHSRN